MKIINKKPILFSLILLICFGQSYFTFSQTGNQKKEDKKEENGALRQKIFFERLHAPLIMPGPDYYNDLALKISNMPNENAKIQALGVNSWQYFGAPGVKVNLGNSKFSGRITNMELHSTDNNSLRVVSASGGLWRFDGTTNPTPVSMSDNLSSLWGGAVATNPNDSSIVFLGTGEPSQHSGTGLFKTTDMGITWQSVAMTPTPTSFYKLFYTPGNPMIMHAATADGYYRSDDGGVSWNRKFFFGNGNCTDLVINSQNTSILYLAYWSHGVYKSIDGGDTWVLQTGLPVSNVGRTVLCIGNVNPDIVYVNMTNDNNNNTKGIYKTTNGGQSWVTCVFGNDLSGNPGTGEFHSGQGWYNNDIGVCPTNDNIVLAGGVGMWRTTDGFTFTEIDPRHADQHAMVWNANGTDVFIGNDGGVFYSNNAGFSFSTINVSKYNSLPVSQYYHFSIGKSNANVVAGTTQDNGFHFKSFATAGTWNCTGGGDGSGVAVDPIDSNAIIYGNGIYGGTLQSHRFLTLNGGSAFNNVDIGIAACTDWFPELRISQVLNVYYTACERNVYYSNNKGGIWSLLNPANSFTGDVWDFTVSNDAVNDANVYACLENGVSIKLMVYDASTQTWANRSAGLPTNTYIRKVAVDINDPAVAYALAGGIPGNGAGNKVFKTSNRGINWTNISGNLPNVAVTDLIAYPGNSNLLYLSSESGAFKSIDGGTTWMSWTHGMPPVVLINELDYVDSLSINGKFYIGACTYGRGLWIREVSGDDPTGIVESDKKENLFMSQNTGNPGQGLTKIVYTTSYSTQIKISISDITGKTVAIPVDKFHEKGRHELIFDRNQLNPGIYFYKLSAGNKNIVKKMVVIE